MIEGPAEVVAPDGEMVGRERCRTGPRLGLPRHRADSLLATPRSVSPAWHTPAVAAAHMGLSKIAPREAPRDRAAPWEPQTSSRGVNPCAAVGGRTLGWEATRGRAARTPRDDSTGWAAPKGTSRDDPLSRCGARLGSAQRLEGGFSLAGDTLWAPDTRCHANRGLPGDDGAGIGQRSVGDQFAKDSMG